MFALHIFCNVSKSARATGLPPSFLYYIRSAFRPLWCLAGVSWWHIFDTNKSQPTNNCFSSVPLHWLVPGQIHACIPYYGFWITPSCSLKAHVIIRSSLSSLLFTTFGCCLKFHKLKCSQQHKHVKNHMLIQHTSIFLFKYAVGGLGNIKFYLFIVGWMHAFLSEWAIITIIIM